MLPGDEILCADCRASLAVAPHGAVDGFWRHLEVLPDGFREAFTPEDTAALFCRICGGGALPQRVLGAKSASLDIRDAVRPMMLVRSGAWVGWRALGGE